MNPGNLASLGRRVSTGMPSWMKFLTFSLNQSRLIELFGTGSKTTPKVVCCDSCGFRVGVPPNVTPNCVLQSTPVRCVPGQRIGSEVPAAVTLPIGGCFSWNSDGATKPSPHEPRTKRVLVGCQRRLTFRFVVPPKSL